MKFQRLKDMLCGALIATLVIGSGTVAFAKAANMTIPVSYNNIKVIVNGEQLQTSKEPFTYEGTTYLPIRAVAEAVGMDVAWDGATKTVTLSGGAAAEKEDTGLFASSLAKKPYVRGGALKITCTDVKENFGYLGGFEMAFNIENNSSMHYSVSVEEIKVNGRTISGFMYTDVMDHRTVTDTLSVWDKDLEGLGITEIKEITIVFDVTNMDGYDSELTKEMVIDFTK